MGGGGGLKKTKTKTFLRHLIVKTASADGGMPALSLFTAVDAYILL